MSRENLASKERLSKSYELKCQEKTLIEIGSVTLCLLTKFSCNIIIGCLCRVLQLAVGVAPTSSAEAVLSS